MPCAPTAPPIYHFAHAEQRHVLTTCTQPVLFCTVRTHERTYANPSPTTVNPCALLSMTRPALTAGPPSQRPFLSGLANCYAPSRRLVSRSAHQSSHQTHSDQWAFAIKVKSQIAAAHKQQAFTAILSCSTSRRGGAWRVQLLSSNRHSNVN